ncbi:MAG: tRNA (N6-isopentenyl adenosine(37)-C2)-methylthiotransferase MiaB [Spirochaetes bacterium]|nr:tRNA (N6-isopentenyl adenosine(37)-C2)-methylthiotransferase MiaB [Spirochaetota bacterium]
MSKHYYIETFGCQMNKNDSELMEENLQRYGYVPAQAEKDADIVIFNTCSVRNHAENRALARIRQVKKRTGKIIAVAGCMAQRLGERLIAQGLADMVIGPYQSPIVGELIEIYISSGKRAFLSQNLRDFHHRLQNLLVQRNNASWHRWVTITHGCENFCAYCVVPYVRGRLISFSSRTIVEYVRTLAAQGAKEITLLGQNVNQFGHDSGDIPFHSLLENVAKVPGIQKINFLTSHPKDFRRETLEVIRDNPNISRAIHLPLQSGSNDILRAMNRQYTIEHYYRLIEEMEHILGDYAISTDLIVGFPGESRADFEKTIEAVRRICFDDAFTYAYSPREGTAAYAMAETISKEEKSARLNELIAVQREISRMKLQKRINRNENALVEAMSKKSQKEVMGKTFLNHPVVLPGGRDDIGQFVRVKILKVVGNTLYAERIA